MRYRKEHQQNDRNGKAELKSDDQKSGEEKELQFGKPSSSYLNRTHDEVQCGLDSVLVCLLKLRELLGIVQQVSIHGMGRTNTTAVCRVPANKTSKTGSNKTEQKQDDMSQHAYGFSKS